VDLDNPSILEQRERASLIEEVVEADGLVAIGPNDLGSHHAIELLIVEFVHLAHAARGDPFNGLEAVEGRQRSVPRRFGRSSRVPGGFERPADREILSDEPRQRRSQIGPVGAHHGRVDERPIGHVDRDPTFKARLEVRVRHACSRSFR